LRPGKTGDPIGLEIMVGVIELQSPFKHDKRENMQLRIFTFPGGYRLCKGKYGKNQNAY
jgi:hypothetical protein